MSASSAVTQLFFTLCVWCVCPSRLSVHRTGENARNLWVIQRDQFQSQRLSRPLLPAGRGECENLCLLEAVSQVFIYYTICILTVSILLFTLHRGTQGIIMKVHSNYKKCYFYSALIEGFAANPVKWRWMGFQRHWKSSTVCIQDIVSAKTFTFTVSCVTVTMTSTNWVRKYISFWFECTDPLKKCGL